ncbi:MULTISPECIES: ethanolamine utilization protein EutH [Salimicrobium]|uniref:Ethanolamine utilization protein EutH n=1 Tax=Salimicrobium humidisoli TaxID=2029857 RepID=A0ABX4HPK6_9BACI|nr:MULTISPECIES: ethanolamine utilization protein EutH [Salimicrobium]PBB05129.1 ethanolamine utilization protein EutH [Salimicrobium humidisoli]
MTLNDWVLGAMCFFLILGALDYYILNSRLKLGDRFYEAFRMMGTLALAMIGVISFAPVMAEWMAPVVVPLYEWLGADPGMFPSMLLAIDTGAYPLAESLAEDAEAAVFSWSLLGTMMGSTVVFTIPVALSVLHKQDYRYFAKGVLIGFTTIPVGCFTGGFLGGYAFDWMLVNLLPSIVLAIVISIGLGLFTAVTIRLFAAFGKIVEVLIAVGLVSITIETLLGVSVIQGLAPLSEGAVIVAKITVTLAGAFPLVAFLERVLQRPFEIIRPLVKVDKVAMTGLLASLAHNIPMLVTMKDMEPRGKVINSAFAVSGAFALGAHIAFVAGIEKDMVVPVLAGKLSAGFLAVVIAWAVTTEEEGKSHEKVVGYD